MFVVVDDPIGCVAPSDGVKIVRGQTFASFKPAGAQRYLDLGAAVIERPRSMGKTTAVNAAIKSPYKTKRLHKGLRP